MTNRKTFAETLKGLYSKTITERVSPVSNEYQEVEYYSKDELLSEFEDWTNPYTHKLVLTVEEANAIEDFLNGEIGSDYAIDSTALTLEKFVEAIRSGYRVELGQ